MAEPTSKYKEVEQAIKALSGADRRDSIRADRCIPPPIGCGGDATKFRDELSRREFTISGLCQKCQDNIFGLAEN